MSSNTLGIAASGIVATANDIEALPPELLRKAVEAGLNEAGLARLLNTSEEAAGRAIDPATPRAQLAGRELGGCDSYSSFSFWASAITCRVRVVLPEDSGP